MPILAIVVSLLFPRIMIFVLYAFTDWFQGLYDQWFWPFLGFLLMPVTLLWYSFVLKNIGQWNTLAVIGMVLAISIDMGLWKSSTKQKKKG